MNVRHEIVHYDAVCGMGEVVSGDLSRVAVFTVVPRARNRDSTPSGCSRCRCIRQVTFFLASLAHDVWHPRGRSGDPGRDPEWITYYYDLETDKFYVHCPEYTLS